MWLHCCGDVALHTHWTVFSPADADACFVNLSLQFAHGGCDNCEFLEMVDREQVLPCSTAFLCVHSDSLAHSMQLAARTALFSRRMRSAAHGPLLSIGSSWLSACTHEQEPKLVERYDIRSAEAHVSNSLCRCHRHNRQGPVQKQCLRYSVKLFESLAWFLMPSCVMERSGLRQVNENTTPNFHGLAAIMEPASSWAAKWRHLSARPHPLRLHLPTRKYAPV